MDRNLQEIVTLCSIVDDEINSLNATISSLSGTKSWLDLERRKWNLVAGALADSGASGNVPNSTQTTPGINCASRAIDPQGKSYADAMWYLQLGANPNLTKFTYSLSAMFLTLADAQACQTKENDFQQTISGMTYNWGFQFAFVDGFFRVWNRGNKSWNATIARAPRWTPGEWMNIVYSFHRDDSNVYYDSVEINGVITELNISYPSVQTGLGDQLNPGEQLDGNSVGAKYLMYLDAVSITGAP